jgi:hypothetical protein
MEFYYITSLITLSYKALFLGSINFSFFGVYSSFKKVIP